MRKCLEGRWGEKATTEFTERFVRRQTKQFVYAELSVFEHFYRKSLSFLGNDPYIGCSKPSCYCCDLYMQLHPQKVLRRPCHDSAWVRWCLPVQKNTLPMESGTNTIDMVKEMVTKMRDDIFCRDFPLQSSRMPESTTGITRTGSS